MENVKINFEELKKMLSGALSIMEEYAEGLEKRVSELEERLQKLEQKFEQEHVGADVVLGGVFEADAVAGDNAEDDSDNVRESEMPAEEAVADFEDEPLQDCVENFEDAPEEKSEENPGEENIVEENLEEEEIGEENLEEEGKEVSEKLAGEREEFSDMIPENEDNKPESEVGKESGISFEYMAEDTGIEEIAEKEEVYDEPLGENDGLGYYGEAKMINDAAKPDWYDWEVDYPASYIDDVYKGISFNDRYEFVKELFNVTGNLDEAEMIFKETLDAINEMENFKVVVAYMRERFPQWDEQSDEVYRFYMAVRRKFNR
ncbi:MAG: hypothetical protein IJ296_01780 [Bacteroidales bacterium]|nr:hypothetical protein [Bacteroidales bacterium]